MPAPAAARRTTHAREQAIQQAAGLRVDRERCVIEGVRVLGLESKNGYSYAREAVAAAVGAGLYEGLAVNFDHAPLVGGLPAPRNYADRLGELFGARQEDDGGIRADLRFNPKHPLAESLVWYAENMPHRVGLSQDAETIQGKGPDGRKLVTEITRLFSVDVVGDPATTGGLREQVETRMNPEMVEALMTLMSNQEMAPAMKAGKCLEAMGLPMPVVDQDWKDEGELREYLKSHKSESAKGLVRRLEEYEAKDKDQKEMQECVRLCLDEKLPDSARTEAFVRSLTRESTEAGRRELIRDRKALLHAQRTAEQAAPGATPSRPTSAGRGEEPLTYEGFLKGLPV